MLDLKRILIVGIGIILIILIIIGAYFYIKNKKNDENQIIEYTPEEEISDEQLRQTIVSLYFKRETELVPEARLMDVKELLEEPYEKIINLLIEGPKNQNLEKTIPEGTKINKIEKQGEVLIIDFSKEFIEKHIGGEIQENLTINSIVKTLTELTEINGVKIKIDGEENKCFKDEIIKFDKIFSRQD